MNERIDVRVIDGRHYACMEDMRDDTLRQYNETHRPVAQIKCALLVIQWLEGLIKFNRIHHPEDYEQTSGNEILWKDKAQRAPQVKTGGRR